MLVSVCKCFQSLVWRTSSQNTRDEVWPRQISLKIRLTSASRRATSRICVCDGAEDGTSVTPATRPGILRNLGTSSARPQLLWCMQFMRSLWIEPTNQLILLLNIGYYGTIVTHVMWFIKPRKTSSAGPNHIRLRLT